MPLSVRFQLGATELELQPTNPNPVVSDDIVRTLSMLMAYDNIVGRFDLLRITQENALYVTDIPEVNFNYVATDFNVTVAGTQILVANTTRKKVLIYPNGNGAVYLALTQTLLGQSKLFVYPNTPYEITNYQADLWAKSVHAQPTTLTVVEFY